jgi:hypothetical protein
MLRSARRARLEARTVLLQRSIDWHGQFPDILEGRNQFYQWLMDFGSPLRYGPNNDFRPFFPHHAIAQAASPACPCTLLTLSELSFTVYFSASTTHAP